MQNILRELVKVDKEKFIKAINEGRLGILFIQYIIEKSKDSDGKINNLGKACMGIIGSLVIMFFFMIGYSFLYGICFGKSSKYISLLDIWLNTVPLDSKFVISIGILILTLTCIFIMPMKNLFFKESLLVKLINIIVIIFCGYSSLYAFKYTLIGNPNITYDDLYMIFILISFPLFGFGISYLVRGLSSKKNAILFVSSIIITTTIYFFLLLMKIIILTDTEAVILLLFSFMPAVSIISNIIEFFLGNKLNSIISKFESKYKGIVERIGGIGGIWGVIKLKLPKMKKKETANRKIKFTILDFAEMVIYSTICMFIIFLIGAPNFYASFGSYYGEKYPNDKQVISYLQDNIQKQIIGNIVGIKDGNYYISEYPNKNLVIIKSTQAIAETHATGWYNVINNWYYFDSKGVMLKDTTTPDGYKVDGVGAWIQ